MKEASLRARHRQLGVILAIFIMLQAATGIVITLGQFSAGAAHGHGEQSVRETAGARNEGHSHGKSATPGTAHDTSADVLANIVMTIHHGGGTIGGIYRILLGTGLVLQTLMGILILFNIRSRSKSRSSKN